MKMVKSLILGSAAGLLAMGGAQAADLPVKAKAVEYVRICSLYGAGFYYIPGTDTCIKLGGYLHAEIQFNGNGQTNGPNWNGNPGQANRLRNQYQYRAREDLNIDTRTATEYGVVRTYFDATFTWSSGGFAGGGDAIAGGSLGVYHAFIQFAGFTLGKTISQFTSPWGGGPGDNTSYLIGGDDTATGVGQIAYTASFGNGVTGSISLEDQQQYRNSQLFNVLNPAATNIAANWLAGAGPYAPQTSSIQSGSFGGNTVPDIVGQFRVDQAWGLFQLAAAAHDIHASYYNPALETSGHPDDKYGFAVQASLSIKNIPTGPGDSINLDAAFSNGATRYVIGGVSPNSYSMFGGSSLAGAYQSIGIGASTDGVFTNGGQIEKTNAWGIRGAFNHNWNPNWSSSLFGSYTAVTYSSNGKALYCTGFGAVVGGLNATYTCNPDFNIAQVGFRTIWTPVTNLSLSGEVMWVGLDQKMAGFTSPVQPLATKPLARYEFKDQNTVVVGFRARRNF
jgi:hypothetical protein